MNREETRETFTTEQTKILRSTHWIRQFSETSRDHQKQRKIDKYLNYKAHQQR